MTTGLQLRSLVKENGELELSLAEMTVPEPGAGEVVVAMQATPINPSDLGLLLGPADPSTAKVTGTRERPVVTLSIPEAMRRAMAPRLGQSMPVGNEGAGVVVKAGDSPAAQALLGKTVARARRRDVRDQYRTHARTATCLVLAREAPAARRRRVVLREPAHRARHGRDHAQAKAIRHSCTRPRPRISGRC
jgi:NADPH2:quinone reductase